MNRFLAKLVPFLLIQAALLVFVTSYGSTDANCNNYMYTFKDKIDLLVETPSPRIIFVGGSNLAFGLNSETVKRELNLNPVNLGLHGGLGLFVLLRAVEAHVRPGDVVVVSPEYKPLFYGPRCTEALAIELYDVWPGCKRYLQADFDRPLDDMAPPASHLQKLARCVQTTRRRLSKPDMPFTSDPGVYKRHSFNRYGDHTAHYAIGTDKHPTFDGELIPLPEPGAKVFRESVDRLNEFERLCRSKSANVYFAHSPVPSVYLDRQPKWSQQVHQRLQDQLNIPFITTPEMLAFNEAMFYDGIDHLTETGAELRTAIVCAQIRRYRSAENRSNDGRLMR